MLFSVVVCGLCHLELGQLLGVELGVGDHLAGGQLRPDHLLRLAQKCGHLLNSRAYSTLMGHGRTGSRKYPEIYLLELIDHLLYIHTNLLINKERF